MLTLTRARGNHWGATSGDTARQEAKGSVTRVAEGRSDGRAAIRNASCASRRSAQRRNTNETVGFRASYTAFGKRGFVEGETD